MKSTGIIVDVRKGMKALKAFFLLQHPGQTNA